MSSHTNMGTHVLESATGNASIVIREDDTIELHGEVKLGPNIKVGSLWRHTSGDVYRVAKNLERGEHLLTGHDLTRERVAELKADGIDPNEFSMVVETSWFQHAATQIGEKR